MSDDRLNELAKKICGIVSTYNGKGTFNHFDPGLIPVGVVNMKALVLSSLTEVLKDQQTASALIAATHGAEEAAKAILST